MSTQTPPTRLTPAEISTIMNSVMMSIDKEMRRKDMLGDTKAYAPELHDNFRKVRAEMEKALRSTLPCANP